MLSATVLRIQLEDTLLDLENQIREVGRQAREMDIEPLQMRDTSGNWVLTPLLVAKAQVLHSLVQLNELLNKKQS